MPRQKKPFFVPLIIVLNILVAVLWHSHFVSASFMEDHFLASWSALQEGRYWVLLGSAFSHTAFWHIFLNMFVLQSFGSILEIVLGGRRFVIFYLIAGILGSLGHCLASNYLLHSPDLPALGASGAIAGVILVFSLLFPKEKILILGLIPIPAIWGALAFIGMDLWGLLAQWEGGGLPIGHGAHLGGAATGIVYYFFFLRNFRKKNSIQRIN